MHQRRLTEGAIPDAGTGDEGADRNDAAGEPLGQRHHVRNDVVAVAGEAVAATAQARLHLVGDKERAGRIANLAHRFEIPRRRDVYAAFALHRLDDKGRRFPQRNFQRGNIAVRHAERIGEQRPERRLKGLAPAHRERAQRLSVVGVGGADDFRATGRGTREFDRALDRLRPAVAPERDLQIAGRKLREAPRRAAEHDVEHGFAGERD